MKNVSKTSELKQTLLIIHFSEKNFSNFLPRFCDVPRLCDGGNTSIMA